MGFKVCQVAPGKLACSINFTFCLCYRHLSAPAAEMHDLDIPPQAANMEQEINQELLNSFDRDTQLKKISTSSNAVTTFVGHLDASWTNMANIPFGGYINAFLMRALLETAVTLGFNDPVSLYVNFITACGLSDRIEIDVSVEKKGNVYSFFQMSLYADNKLAPGTRGELATSASAIVAVNGLRSEPMRPTDLHSDKRLTVDRYRLQEDWKDPQHLVNFDTFTSQMLGRKLGGFFTKFDSRIDVEPLIPIIDQVERGCFKDKNEIMDLAVTNYVRYPEFGNSYIAAALLADYGFAINFNLLNYLNTPSKTTAVTNGTLGMAIHFLRPLHNRKLDWVRSRADFSIVGGPITEFELSMYEKDEVPFLFARQVGWGRIRELDLATGRVLVKSKL